MPAPLFPRTRRPAAQITRFLWRFCKLGAAIVLAKLGYDWLISRIALLEDSAEARMMIGLVITALAAYVILIAVPFVPGIEIGLGLLILMGPDIAPFVYLATLMGMSLAFCVGQYMSRHWLRRFCRDMRLRKLGTWLARQEGRNPAARQQALVQSLPLWLQPALTRYRYLTIAALFNIPGNMVIGGGGGIMMMAGFSRLFHTGWMLLTIALAILPLPLFIWLSGDQIFSFASMD